MISYLNYLCCRLATLGGFMMIFAEKPKDAYTIVVMVILGAGMSGL